MNVSIIGATLTGNKGAEAMLQTTSFYIREDFPEANINIFSYYPKPDCKIHNPSSANIEDATPLSLVLKIFPFSLLCFLCGLLKIRVPDLFLTREVRVLRQSDILIDISGITFSDGREKFLPFNVLCIWPAMLLGVKVVKLSQAMGPFYNPITKLCAKCFLPRCRYIFARGKNTLGYLQELYGAGNADFAADSGFLFNDINNLLLKNKIESIDRLICQEQDIKKKYVVGVCPSSVVYSKSKAQGIDYINIYANFINSLIDKKGYHVILLPNAVRENVDLLRNNDVPVIKKIFKEVNGKNVTVIDEDIGAAGLKKAIGLCDYFIASRFHSMIASLSLCVPTIVCGWGHKYFEVLDLFGLREYAFDYKQLSEQLLESKFDVLIEEEENIRSTLELSLPDIVKNANKQIEFLRDVMVE